MRGIFTRDERAVVLFLAASLVVGSTVLLVRRVEPSAQVGAEAEFQTVRAADPAWPIDLNAASVEELIRLPGIGPVRAAAVVELRKKRGRFSSVDELLDVKGIGERTLERLRPLASVEDTARSIVKASKEAGTGDLHDR